MEFSSQATCVNNVLADVVKLGCAAGDTVCACKSSGFNPGIKDCVTQACVGPLGEDASQVDEAVNQASGICAGKMLLPERSSEPG